MTTEHTPSTETGQTAAAGQPVSVAIQTHTPKQANKNQSNPNKDNIKSEVHTESSQAQTTSNIHPPKTPLLDAMREYDGLGRLRFHVPGHAGQPLVETALGAVPGLSAENYRFDYTELEGMDVLSEPSECLADAQQAAAEAFGVRDSFFLVNGSTVGLMAGMLATLRPGDAVLLPRNVHRSILNGLILTGAVPVWMLPEAHPAWGLWGQVSLDALRAQLAKTPQIKAFILSSPTYEGIGSDIEAIAQMCQQHHIRLIVDEAHGSLWPFSDRLPMSACHLPCDLVIHSLHKTAGSLTQSAMAHLPFGSTITAEAYQQALNTLHTTSPSYLLLASLEATRAFLQSDSGQDAIARMLTHVQELRQACSGLQQFQCFEPNDLSNGRSRWDPSKLFIRCPGVAGTDWAPQIEAEGIPEQAGQGKIAYEAATPFGALYLVSLGLSKADYEQFFKTFAFYDRQHSQLLSRHRPDIHANAACHQDYTGQALLPDIAILPRDAFFAPGIMLKKAQTLGRISRQTVVHCPPGIPILMPGERIHAHHLPFLPDQISVIQ